MPTIRNPFRKAPQPTPTVQFNGSTDSLASSTTTTTESFGASSGVNSFGRPHSPLSLSTEFNYKGSNSPKPGDAKPVTIVRGKVDEYAGEYKLSVVNDSGVYLPPSPTEKKSFWGRNAGSDSPIDRTSMDEPFTIPRESCEGYRRSFDISARSPVGDIGRSSLNLDGRSPRPSFEKMVKLSLPVRIDEAPATADDGFEEIKLDDNKPKKRGIFGIFGGDSTTTSVPSSKFIPFKRDHPAESVHESELKRIPAPEKLQVTA